MASFKFTLVFGLLSSTSLASVLPRDFLLERGTCQHGSRVINGTTFTTSCGVDRPGGDYKSVQAGSWEACIAACGSDGSCASATYHEGNGYCYLKNTLTWESIASGEDTIVRGTGCQGRSRTIDGRSCTVTCGTDYSGGDNGYKKQTASFEECQQYCAADTTCVGAQYRESTGWCYTKGGTGSSVDMTPKPDPDVDSVFCGASPTTPNFQHTSPPTCKYEGTAYNAHFTQQNGQNCTFDAYCDVGFINTKNPLSSYGYPSTVEDCMQSLAMNAQYGQAVAFEVDANGYCTIYGSRQGVEPGIQVSRPGTTSGYFNAGSCKWYGN